MLNDFIQEVQPAIDAELQLAVAHPKLRSYPGLESILRYHLGWDADGEKVVDQGKRIRPLLVLLAANAVGGNWQQALPSAAAVELLHNFSLIHDDIEDCGEMRRGRPSVWKKWGEALAINAGDALFTLSFDELKRLKDTVGLDAAYRSLQVLVETCIQLTGGQHLDISFERERSLSIDSYWTMIAGKTAALLSACLRLGAIAGGASADREYYLGQFGYFLGLSFQVWDDWLGIWGNAVHTGKSAEGDLVLGKKTLPILFALERGERFAQRWLAGPIEAREVSEVSNLLIDEGAQTYTEEQADQLMQQAIRSLQAANCETEDGRLLEQLALSLLKRAK